MINLVIQVCVHRGGELAQVSTGGIIGCLPVVHHTSHMGQFVLEFAIVGGDRVGECVDLGLEILLCSVELAGNSSLGSGEVGLQGCMSRILCFTLLHEGIHKLARCLGEGNGLVLAARASTSSFAAALSASTLTLSSFWKAVFLDCSSLESLSIFSSSSATLAFSRAWADAWSRMASETRPISSFGLDSWFLMVVVSATSSVFMVMRALLTRRRASALYSAICLERFLVNCSVLSAACWAIASLSSVIAALYLPSISARSAAMSSYSLPNRFFEASAAWARPSS